jgi:predicted outer membrane repeat protein
LEVDSLAANAGDPSYSGGLTTDQRGTGYNRIQGSVIDIGAFESNYTNTAPTLNNTGNPTLTAINEDVSNISNTGSLVSAIIASGAGGNPITDLDSGAVEGIAVTAVDNSNGTWQYSTDGGINWSNFTLSATSATLLRDTASDRIRFIPNPNFNGNANITFRAWDASDGNPSGTTGINPGTGGGATAFSTAIETARITVNPVNDTSFIVTNTNDSGIGSLRQAIIDANNDSGVETIRFDTTGIFGDATLDTIILTSGQLTITEEVIIQGTGADKLTISGGGGSRVFKATAPLTINGLKITQGNVSSGKGGGINSDSSVTLTNSIISDNTANTGGGIYSDGSVTLTNSTISDNVAGANGGGGIRSDVSVTVINSTISGNTADNNGGGIRSEGSVTVINSTISSNTANNNGGGIRSSGGTISNSTITNNTADNDNDGSGNGGGISNSGAATYTISNSIIAGNFDKGNEAPDIDGQNLNGNGYNLVGNLSGKSSGTLGTGVDIVNPNPKLKPLGNYGGTTQTHGLAFDSLAVNGGNPSYSGSLTNDQRGTGYDRIQNGKLDIGAFESVFPEASFGAATYNTTEGSTAIQINIPVSLDRIPEVDAIVPIQIKGSSTATKDVDYTISPNSLTFVAGSTGSDLTQLVTITIKPDDLPENAETVILYFGNLQEAIPGAITETTLNIAANDPIQYAISTANLSLTEGNTSKQTFTFTVTRSGGIGVASTVDYAFSGTASYNSDYNNILIRSGEVSLIGEFIDGDLSGTLNFAPGEKTKTITVDILGDKAFELNEDITVTLSNPNLTNAPENSTITTNQAKVDIINDDTQPSVNITDVSVTEGNTGALTNANFVVTLSNASYQQVVVNYSTSDDTAQVSDLDYNSGLGTIIFNPGETSKNISVGVRGDNKFEVNEKFSVNLFGAANAVITDSLGVAHIINDDNNQLPSIRISDVSVQEGYAAMITNATFAVTLSNPSFQQVIVNYSTSDGSARVSDSDYSSGLGTVIFNPGETSKNISFGVRGDTKRESNETFFVNLYGATNAAIADSQGVATIINDDF